MKRPKKNHIRKTRERICQSQNETAKNIHLSIFNELKKITDPQTKQKKDLNFMA